MNYELENMLFERPGKLKVFISSQMRDNVLNAERQTAAKAIDRTGLACAWLWENDASAGPYSAEAICLGHARTSDGLILLLAEQLTPVTQKEYEAAYLAGVPCYIFLKQGAQRDRKAERFIKAVREKSAVTANFEGLSELETQITRAMFRYAVDSIRERIQNTKINRVLPMEKHKRQITI